MNASLHDALHRAADDSGFVCDTTGTDLLRRARQRQARRGLVSGVAGLGVVAAVAMGVATTTLPGMFGPDEAPVAVQAPAETVPGADHILARCADAFDDRDEELPTEPRLFGPRAVVITADVSGAGTAAFILGSDRRFYAECNLAPGGGNDWIHEYSVGAAPAGGQNTLYLGRDGFTYRDRFPAEVARVRLDLYGGQTLSAPAVEGFVAFNPAHAGTSDGPERITLFDQNGTVLARANWGELPPRYDSLLPSGRR